MSRLDAVLAFARRRVEPRAVEARRVSELADRALARVEAAASQLDPPPEVLIGGSYAKGTWLRDDVDVDIFLRFPSTLSKPELERLGLRIGQAAFGRRLILRYAEHPYVEVHVDGMRVNAVPCYAVQRGAWQSAADRSPFHTQYICEHLSREGQTEVRVLKTFLGALGLYGAELAVQGFSGYVCEVLTLRYGSFDSVLEAAANFQRGTVVSLEPPSYDPTTVFTSPLVILDPVDERRNLGTAIAPESVGRFMLAARSFLRAPAHSYFRPREAALTRVFRDALLLVTFRHEPRSVDILWGQLRRTAVRLGRQLELAGVRVLRSAPASDHQRQSAILFLIADSSLPPYELRRGPEVFAAEDTARFLARNISPRTLWWLGSEGRLYAARPRLAREVGVLLRGMLQRGGTGVAAGLAPGLRRTGRVWAGEQAARIIQRSPWLRRVAAELGSSDRRLVSAR